MRPFEKDLSKALGVGLRRFDESPRNILEMIVCHNLLPMAGGLKAFENVLNLGESGITWGGQGVYVKEED